METIGLIAAMPQESNALIRYIKGWERIALGRFDCKSFELYEHNCMLVTSGMGIQRASEATRKLIESNSPRWLISFGIAGAVEPDLEIGDVVAVETVCHLDQGVVSPPLSLNHLPDAARQAAEQSLAKKGAHLISGTAITTGGSQVFENQLIGLVHPVLEMETSGIAQLAVEKGIPVLSLRAISDGPRAPIPFDLDEVMDENANLRAGRILMAIVRNPRIVLQFGGSMRNSRLAADNAAVALLAVLNQLTIEKSPS
jgi:nucleoside phosphorylase